MDYIFSLILALRICKKFRHLESLSYNFVLCIRGAQPFPALITSTYTSKPELLCCAMLVRMLICQNYTLAEEIPSPSLTKISNDVSSDFQNSR
jgi:hypothetical protein